VLLLLLTSLFGLVGRGTFFSSDEGGIFNTSLSLVQRHTLAIGPGENVHPGADGRLYACREILPSLLSVPPAVAGMAVEARRAAPPPAAPTGAAIDGTNWPIFLTVTLLGPLGVAGTLLLLHAFVREEGGTRGDALALAGAAGWATPLAVYSKTLFPQVFEGLWIMLALLAAVRWRRAGGVRPVLLAGLACGLGLMTRPAFVFVTAAFAVYFALARPQSWRQRIGSLALLGAPAAAGGAATALVNWLRWGSPFDFGYHNAKEAFSTSFLTGLYGLLASPGKGLFVYAPVLVLAVLFGRRLWRGGRAEVVLLLAITAAYLGLYARWYDWTGGLAWGPRFLVPLIAPWLALLGRAFAGPGRPRLLFLATVVLGFGVQVLGLSVHPKWAGWQHVDAFSLTHSDLPVMARTLYAKGPDDFWLWSSSGPTRPLQRPFTVALVFCAVLSAVLLWRGGTTRGERLAVGAMVGLLALMTAGAILPRWG
jgi:hypothetical protein